MSTETQMVDNPYRTTMVVTSALGVVAGVIMLMVGEPELGETLSTTQLLGGLLFSVGVTMGVAWLAVSALMWQR